MSNEAVLSSDKVFTSFRFNGHNIRFKTSPRLERYTRIIEWDNGYIVVMAKYEGHEEEEEYIDLVPILENLYFDVDEFLKPIQKVRIEAFANGYPCVQKLHSVFVGTSADEQTSEGIHTTRQYGGNEKADCSSPGGRE